MIRTSSLRITIFLAITACIASAQNPLGGTQVALAGPEEITSRVYVMDQPDSPIEVIALDFTESWLSVSESRYSRGGRCKVTVRNRGDKPVHGASIALHYRHATGGGGTAGSFRANEAPLLPGQQRDLQGCGGGGSGGKAPTDSLRLFVLVEWVDLDDYDYKPSVRIPRESGLRGSTF